MIAGAPEISQIEISDKAKSELGISKRKTAFIS